jgi:hypothetical protein
MANKIFYIKQLADNKELCMVGGYIEREFYHLFIRDKNTFDILEVIGDYKIKEAWEIYEKL